MINEREEPVLNPIESEKVVEEVVSEPIAEELSEVNDVLQDEQISTEVQEVVIEETSILLETTQTIESLNPVNEELTPSETVDFSFNETVIAIETSTVSSDALDLPREPELEEEIEEEHEVLEDYSHYSKAQFIGLIKHLASDKENNYKKTNALLKEIKPFFDDIAHEEKQIALDKFIAEGGNKDDFDYRENQDTHLFYQLYQQIQKQRSKQIAQLEEQKEKNLERKNTILEKLRTLTEAEESQASIEELKRLQHEWRSIGAVVPQYNRALWASYNALIDLFYNKRSIYFELKELDRRKNLALKLSICERAEKLVDYTSIQKATRELNELHEEYKHIGPIPKEEQEALWQRFKAASDKVYDKKRDFIRGKEDEKKKNLELKLAICEQIKPFADFQTDKIAEWNEKTKELLDLQKKWDVIRFIPHESIKETSKKFWLYFKAFFNNKNTFIRTLDEEREANLAQKTSLCEQAEALIEADQDPRKIADKLKDLQKKWKEIGPVPSKFRDSIYERFKKACDSFFERRRENYNSQEKVYEDNLKAKLELCKKIEALKPELAEAQTLIDGFLDEWKSIGFVPKKDKQFIQQKFEKNLFDFIEHIAGISIDEKEKMQLTVELEFFKDSPQAQRKVEQKESVLRRKIQKLEADIETLRNNMGFFAKSKEANKLKENIEKQIAESNERLKDLKRQLKLFQNL